MPASSTTVKYVPIEELGHQLRNFCHLESLISWWADVAMMVNGLPADIPLVNNDSFDAGTQVLIEM